MQMVISLFQKNRSSYRSRNTFLLKFLITLELLGIASFCGCMLQPRLEKELFAKWVPRNQMAAVKRTIIDEGYEIVGKEDFQWAGAICTNFSKELTLGENKTTIQVLLSFKEPDSPKEFYRNIGISVLNQERPKAPEVKTEVSRMEVLLYNKLLETAGKDNVNRSN